MQMDWETWKASKEQDARIGTTHATDKAGATKSEIANPAQRQRDKTATEMRARRSSYLMGTNEFDFSSTVALIQKEEEERAARSMVDAEKMRAKQQSKTVLNWQAALNDKKIAAARLILTWYRRWREKHPKVDNDPPRLRFLRDKSMASSPSTSPSHGLSPEQLKARDEAIAKQAAKIKKESDEDAERLKNLRERGQRQIAEWRAKNPEGPSSSSRPQSRSQNSTPQMDHNGTNDGERGQAHSADPSLIDTKDSQDMECFLNEINHCPEPETATQPEDDLHRLDPAAAARHAALSSNIFMSCAMNWTAMFLPGLPNQAAGGVGGEASGLKPDPTAAAAAAAASPPDPSSSPSPPPSYAWPQTSAHGQFPIDPSKWTSSGQQRNVLVLGNGSVSNQLQPRSATSMSTAHPNSGHGKRDGRTTSVDPRGPPSDYGSRPSRAKDATPPGSQRTTPLGSILGKNLLNPTASPGSVNGSTHLPPVQTTGRSRRSSVDLSSRMTGLPPMPVGGAKGRRGSIDESLLMAAAQGRDNLRLPDIKSK